MNEPTSRNAPCPCGSGKRYKHCHGATNTAPPAIGESPEWQARFLRTLELHQAGRLAEAGAAYHELLRDSPGNPHVLHYLGVLEYQHHRLPEAERLLREALAADPAIPMAVNNLGLILKDRNKLPEALACFDRAIAQDPGDAVAHNNRGLVLCDMGRLEEAAESCRRALAIKPDFAEALGNLGKTLYELGHHEEAVSVCQKAITLVPDLPYVGGHWLHSKMQCCDWKGLDDAYAWLRDAVAKKKKVSVPFPLLAIPCTPLEQLQCARAFVEDKHPAGPPVRRGETYKHERIRIGYLSADYYNHATAHLISTLIEIHDRERFEIIGISFGPRKNDIWRQRLEKAFDRFFDVQGQTDREIADLVRTQEIDIAVDLKGHTKHARTGIFALRPAPIQVNYLGFPGSMGASYIDYLIGDATIIPPEHREAYDERIVYLPHCYFVNDSDKAISARDFSRAELGLPETGFVFCCFNNSYKLTPDAFDIWMRLLECVQGSVLWLLESNAVLTANLRREAKERGVDPDRLIFAPRMPLPEHVARHRQADLFLDTFYYNAHTTTSDALWAGLPVLTCLGDTFAGRVAASMLKAIDLPELITRDRNTYFAKALELATDPTALAAVKHKLAANRTTTPLFDTKLFARHIESAYQAMHDRHRSGLDPEHIDLRQAG